MTKKQRECHPKYYEGNKQVKVKLIQDKRVLDCIGNFITSKGIDNKNPNETMVLLEIPNRKFKTTIKHLKEIGCKIHA